MDGKAILSIIQDVNMWRGDVYRLATIIAEKQREADAQKAEDEGLTDFAETLRTGV